MRDKVAGLMIGTRVRLRAPASGLALKSDLGTIVGPDEYDGDMGYYVVSLDAPALYDHGGDEPEVLDQVVELVDNMDVVAAELPRESKSRGERAS